jgi:hypothetical protein
MKASLNMRSISKDCSLSTLYMSRLIASRIMLGGLMVVVVVIIKEQCLAYSKYYIHGLLIHLILTTTLLSIVYKQV